MDAPYELRRRSERTPPQGGDSAVAPEVSNTDDLDPAQTDEALEQDPDEVPNRLEEPEPPQEEEAGL